MTPDRVDLPASVEALGHLVAATAALTEARKAFPLGTDLFPAEPLSEVERRSIALSLSMIEAQAALLRTWLDKLAVAA